MLIQIGECTENEDGSMNAEVTFDAEFAREAIQHYVTYMLTCALDPTNKEFELKTEEEEE